MEVVGVLDLAQIVGEDEQLVARPPRWRDRADCRSSRRPAPTRPSPSASQVAVVADVIPFEEELAAGAMAAAAATPTASCVERGGGIAGTTRFLFRDRCGRVVEALQLPS